MTLEIPRRWVAVLLAFAVVAVALLLVMTARFGGPTIRLDDPFTLRAAVPDTQGLAIRSDVLVRGVRVGRVAGLDVRGARTDVRLVLDGEPVQLRRGATLRVGNKTLLGEAYVDLDPGPRGAPALRSGTRLPDAAVRPSVEIDEALTVFGPAARRDLVAGIRTFGEGARPADTAARVSGTIGELRRTVQELHTLGRTLRSQTGDISRGVTAGGAVVRELASRDRAVRGLVADGERTLTALAGSDRGLRATVQELPALLRSADRTLRVAAPLLREARPLVADVRAAAAPLTGALDVLPAAATDLRAVLDGAAPLRRAAVPVLRQAGPVVAAARPAVRRLDPALRNLVTVVRYLEPRKATIAAWFANTADLGLNGDAKGSWARFFIFADPASLLSLPSDLQTNAYTQPGDARDNQPYRKGDYPRLMPAPAP